jgi:mycothiol synthase
LESFDEHIRRPNYVPEEEVLVAELGNEVVGYAAVTPELGIGRVVVDCVVGPQHRRKGLATRLLLGTLRHGADLGAQMAQTSVDEGNTAARDLLHKLGFRPIRRHLQMALDLSSVVIPSMEYGDLVFRQLQYGDEAELTHVQNIAFTGTWGFNPNTIEEIVYRLGSTGCSPSDVILVSEAGKPMPIGYCWLMTYPQEVSERVLSKGRIHMLGVAPAFQRRGIGRLLLLAGLDHLMRKGIAIVEVTVDSQNRAATSIYIAAGFRTTSSTLWYATEIDRTSQPRHDL